MPPATSQPPSVRLGFALFAVGLVFVAATLLPFFFGEHNRSLWLNLGCMLAPVGLVMAVAGAVRSGRSDQRAALAAFQRAAPTSTAPTGTPTNGTEPS